MRTMSWIARIICSTWPRSMNKKRKLNPTGSKLQKHHGMEQAMTPFPLWAEVPRVRPPLLTLPLYGDPDVRPPLSPPPPV